MNHMVTREECQEIMSWCTDTKIESCQDCPVIEDCAEYHFENRERVRGDHAT